MKWVTAAVTFVNLSVVCGLCLGLAGRGLNTTSAALALVCGTAFAVAAFLGTRDSAVRRKSASGPTAEQEPRKSSGSEDTQNAIPSTLMRYRRVWFWAVAVCFAAFALRSFVWLLYIDSSELKIQSPNNLGDLSLHLTLIKNFANGVALSAQEDFVLVVETYHYQVRRYWLKGPKAGTSDIFAQDFPGFPDNITRDDNGNFWVALFTPRVDLVDQLHRRPFYAEQVAKLPEALLNSNTAPEKHGLVFELNQGGVVLRSLHDTTGRVFGLTTAQHHSGYLYLGTAPGGSNGVMRYRLSRAEQE